VTALSREGRAAPPVRLLHLGLGNFFRAHQAWYTEHSPDRGDWGYAAFAGRSADLANRLAGQDGLYTLVTRAPEADGYEVVGSVARTHTAADHAAWLGYFSSPALAVVTLTVTEAGYLRRPDGALDLENPVLQGDLPALAADPSAPVLTAPARLVAGLDARRRADGGPLAIVPCDNMAGNGAAVAGVVAQLAERLDPPLAEWIDARVSFVSTTVDRITPRTEPEEAAAVLAASGRRDACPVVTEPFAEWALRGDFPAGRPGWRDAGALFTDDIAPYENRKLWLLNGAHSLLAYGGSIRGHTTVSEAISDETCREWVEDWWAVAGPHLTQPAEVIADYCRTLVERWANPRIRHHLGQIAADGSQKLPIRVLPVLRAERDSGRIPLAATRILAAWICHLRGMGGAPVSDVDGTAFVAAASGPVRAAVQRVLGKLDAQLGDDDAVTAAVVEQVDAFASQRSG
jgi:fructuronate reductase